MSLDLLMIKKEQIKNDNDEGLPRFVAQRSISNNNNNNNVNLAQNMNNIQMNVNNNNNMQRRNVNNNDIQLSSAINNNIQLSSAINNNMQLSGVISNNRNISRNVNGNNNNNMQLSSRANNNNMQLSGAISYRNRFMNNNMQLSSRANNNSIQSSSRANNNNIQSSRANNNNIQLSSRANNNNNNIQLSSRENNNNNNMQSSSRANNNNIQLSGVNNSNSNRFMMNVNNNNNNNNNINSKYEIVKNVYLQQILELAHMEKQSPLFPPQMNVVAMTDEQIKNAQNQPHKPRTQEHVRAYEFRVQRDNNGEPRVFDKNDRISDWFTDIIMQLDNMENNILECEEEDGMYRYFTNICNLRSDYMLGNGVNQDMVSQIDYYLSVRFQRYNSDLKSTLREVEYLKKLMLDRFQQIHEQSRGNKLESQFKKEKQSVCRFIETIENTKYLDSNIPSDYVPGIFGVFLCSDNGVYHQADLIRTYFYSLLDNEVDSSRDNIFDIKSYEMIIAQLFGLMYCIRTIRWLFKTISRYAQFVAKLNNKDDHNLVHIQNSFQESKKCFKFLERLSVSVLCGGNPNRWFIGPIIKDLDVICDCIMKFIQYRDLLMIYLNFVKSLPLYGKILYIFVYLIIFY